jgi:hypothetical protein
MESMYNVTCMLAENSSIKVLYGIHIQCDLHVVQIMSSMLDIFWNHAYTFWNLF